MLVNVVYNTQYGAGDDSQNKIIPIELSSAETEIYNHIVKFKLTFEDFHELDAALDHAYEKIIETEYNNAKQNGFSGSMDEFLSSLDLFIDFDFDYEEMITKEMLKENFAELFKNAKGNYLKVNEYIDYVITELNYEENPEVIAKEVAKILGITDFEYKSVNKEFVDLMKKIKADPNISKDEAQKLIYESMKDITFDEI